MYGTKLPRIRSSRDGIILFAPKCFACGRPYIKREKTKENIFLSHAQKRRSSNMMIAGCNVERHIGYCKNTLRLLF